MSNRRTSGLMPVLCLLLASTTLLAGTSYWLWQEKGRAEQRARQALEERDQSRQEHRAGEARMRELRRRVNRQSELSHEQLLAAADEDLNRLGSETAENSYSEVVRKLESQVENLNIELKQLAADRDRLQQQYLALQQVKQAAVDEAVASSQEARKDLMNEREYFSKKIAARDDDIASIMDRARTLANRLETEKRDKESTREELLSQINRLRTILMEARAPHTPDALARQDPDGTVIRSSAATRTAWLSIGSKDGVEPLLTFSVQPAGFSGNPYTRPKAKLEVVRVNGPNLCEARIVEQTLADPIIPGDLIFNPAWKPGKVMRFALAGLLDMDGDGSDDREQVKQMIRVANAQVDAEVLPDGSERGRVSVETNYFIRGTSPAADQAGPTELRVLSAMAKMERTALDYGAVVIDLPKFLDLLGYAPRQPRR